MMPLLGQSKAANKKVLGEIGNKPKVGKQGSLPPTPKTHKKRGRKPGTAMPLTNNSGHCTKKKHDGKPAKENVVEEDPANDDDTGEEEYYVESIKEHRDTKSGREYLVSWVGYEEQTWVPQEAMNCPDILSNYLQRHEAKLNDRIAQLTAELARARREIVKLGGKVDAPAAALKKRSAIRSINGRFIRRTKQQDVARRDDSEEEDGVPDDESASVCSNSTDTRSSKSTGPAEKMARTTFKPFYHQGKIADGVELVVAPAEGKGEGVFTKKALKKGEFIGDYGGFVSLTSASQAMDSDYLYMTTFGPEGHPVIIDAAPPHGNVFAKLNHSCRPNLVPKELPKPEPSGIFAVGFTTRRYVAPEEELTVDYTRTWWKARPEKVCMCEEVNCKWTDPRKEED